MSDGGLNSVIKIPGSFTDADGQPADQTVTLTITTPDYSADPVVLDSGTIPPVAHDGVGVYHVNYTAALPGRYTWRWESSLGGVLSGVFNISVEFSTDLVSLTAVKKHINADLADTSDDAEMREFISTASAEVNSSCGYSAATAVTEYVPCSAAGSQSLILTQWPVLSVESITPKSVGAFAPNMASLITSDTGVCTLKDGTLFYGLMLVEYTVGRAVVPDELQELTLIVFKWMWETQRGAGSQSIPGMGDGDEPAVSGEPLPPRGQYLMTKYRQPHV